MITLGLKKGSRVLVAGASGDIGGSLLELLADEDIFVGAHYFSNKKPLDKFISGKFQARFKTFKGGISSQKGCQALVKNFIAWQGGIDYLVQLSGDVHNPIHWSKLEQSSWDKDLAVNLTGPFFLAQEAMKYMASKGGKVILTSTASVPHGGGQSTLGYGTAKAGIELLTKGLARGGAKDNILVNTIAPGYIDTQFHTKRVGRNKKSIQERIKMIPLKRAGRPEEVAAMIVYLLSSYGNFITGEVITISGGDWL